MSLALSVGVVIAVLALFMGPRAAIVVGVSLFWDTPIGPLRFNFSEALSKEQFDEEQTFDLTISTQF